MFVEWEKEEGWEVVKKHYAAGRYATVETEAERFLGEDVHRWRVWTVLVGGRLDGTNYIIGQTVVKEGVAPTVEEAMLKCDDFMAAYLNRGERG